MFKSTLKYNLGTVVQNAVLAVAAILGFSLSVRAEDIQAYKTLKVSCNPFSTLDSQCESDLAIKSKASKIAQNRPRRGRIRDRNRKIDGFYTGFSLGAGFPSGGIPLSNSQDTEFPDAEYNNSFVGSLFGGLKFNKNLSADAEFLSVLGGLDTDELEEFTNNPMNNIDIQGTFEADGEYSAFAFYLNPRFELSLSKSLNLYLSPGIGVSQNIVTFESKDDDSESIFEDSSTISFTYQVKGGASYALNNAIGVFGQVRYVKLETADSVDDIDLFSTEVGMRFNLF